MNYRDINKACYMLAAGSIILATLIGLTTIWADDLIPVQFVAKGIGTTTLLFVSSTLGALVTRLLVVEDPVTKEKN